MKKILLPVCILFVLAVNFSIDLSGAEIIRCQGDSPYHLQGVTGDGESIYWSFTTILYKTDLSGKVLVKKDVPTHHGDLCHHEGKLYVTVALPLEKPVNGKHYDSYIYEYSAGDLSLVKKYNIADVITAGVDGIEWYNGRFYVGDDKGKDTDIKSNTILVFSPDFKLIEKKQVPGWTWFGVQTITYSGGFFWLGNYIRDPKTPTLQMDENFNFVAWHSVNIDVGAVALPLSAVGKPRLLKATIVKTPEGKHSASLTPCILQNGQLVQEK